MSKTGYLLALLTAGWVASYPPVMAQQELPSEVLAYAEIVLYNGKILTADDSFTIVQAVAIRDGKFLAVGETDRILKMAGPKTRRIDLKGQTAIPGLVDLHFHPFTAGMLDHLEKKWLPEKEGKPWRSVDEALADIKKAVEMAKPGELVIIPRTTIVGGGGKGGRAGSICEAFTLEQLDAIAPSTPVFLLGVVNLTAYAINSKAASLIAPLLPQGAAVFVEKGRPCIIPGGTHSGVLPPAMQAVRDHIFWAMPLEEQMAAFRAATKAVSAMGITLAKEHTAPQLLAGIRELWVRGELTVRLRMPFPLTASVSGESVEISPSQAETLFRRIGNISGIGDDMWRFVGIRPASVGGNIRGGDAWTLEPKIRPYPDRAGDPAPFGGRAEERKGEEVFRGREAVVQAVRFGWDVSADHTVGDRAVREVLNAYEEGLKKQVVKTPNQRLTINHTPMAKFEDIQRMKELGIMVSIGPWHLYQTGHTEAAVYAYGPDRVHHILPIKSYIKMGLKPALEADTGEYPTFWKMEKAITRKDHRGRIWGPDEKVTRQEALWMSTNWPAYHLGEEKKVGTIQAGKLADLVVIDGDYMTIPEDQISEIEAWMTIVGGKIVHEAEGKFK